jgi:flavin reductase (DIM6/NTAB) family NADH-FMN oxidoreductase RutF
MTGIIVPRPVALVSTVDRNGLSNLAPFSFFAGVGSNPPTLLFCPVVRSAAAGVGLDPRKDTLRNVEETGEFVVNVVSDAIAAAANATAAEVPPEVDEFVLSGLTPRASEAVRPARVAESPAQMECKLVQVIYTGREPGAGVVVLGEIVRFHLRKNLVDNFRVDPAGLDAVGRMAGNTWARTRDRIELIRPKQNPNIYWSQQRPRAPSIRFSCEWVRSHEPKSVSLETGFWTGSQTFLYCPCFDGRTSTPSTFARRSWRVDDSPTRPSPMSNSITFGLGGSN